MAGKKAHYHHGDLAAALLEAAEAELSTHGIEKFSLRAVAKRAGVSHGAPAHHFGDAKGLLTALAAKGYERLFALQAEREAEAEDSAEERLVASGLGYLEFAMAHPELFRLMFNSAVPNREDADFSRVSIAVFDRLVSGIGAVTGHNPYEDKESRLDLMASWSLVHGFSELIISGRAERVLGLSDMSVEDRKTLLRSVLGRITPPAR